MGMRENPDGSQVTYWQCWWKATWIIFLVRCALGFLSGGGNGLAAAMGGAIILAPISGLIAGGIMYALRKK
jgi:hypothetical protein